ncbi:YlxR family protein [Corynebacterium sp.]|uniref:YlxR family protein n=1 Tax=Corynebacterium sp. TaxID=1720 RepID=UPI002583D15B|nr:YlxR family protein [Corynebacterium sp.]
MVSHESPTGKHLPERTCIATKQVIGIDQLLRCVARHAGEGAEGKVQVVPDPERKLSGRGAWITPTVEAWEIAVKRRAFSRALRVSATVDADPVRDYIVTLPVTVEVDDGRESGRQQKGRGTYVDMKNNEA